MRTPPDHLPRSCHGSPSDGPSSSQAHIFPTRFGPASLPPWPLWTICFDYISPGSSQWPLVSGRLSIAGEHQRRCRPCCAAAGSCLLHSLPRQGGQGRFGPLLRSPCSESHPPTPLGEDAQDDPLTLPWLPTNLATPALIPAGIEVTLFLPKTARGQSRPLSPLAALITPKSSASLLFPRAPGHQVTTCSSPAAGWGFFHPLQPALSCLQVPAISPPHLAFFPQPTTSSPNPWAPSVLPCCCPQFPRSETAILPLGRCHTNNKIQGVSDERERISRGQKTFITKALKP